MSKLKTMRLKRMMTAAELARRLNISRSCVCQAEKLGIKTATAAQRYAAILRCEALEIIEL